MPPLPRQPDLGPPPSPEAVAHSLRLIERIGDEIAAAGGRIPFDRYMELALYAPGLGYYSAGAHKFGAAGDFVTAPEISPLFGQCLARQAQQILDTLGGGDLMEFGAGSGRLAADLLEELERLGSLPGRYLILEPSPDLRRRQAETIASLPPALAERVAWLDRPAERFRGLVIANEVVDAMPVHRFRIGSGGVEEAFVAEQGGRFLLVWERAQSPDLAEAVAAIEQRVGPLPEGFSSEINLRAQPWVGEIAAELEAGAVLLIDYGEPRAALYGPAKAEGTLLCHYRHRAHSDPFIYPGLQDITADVDFTALAQAAQEAGLEVAGYTTQAMFLLGSGLDELTSAALARQPERMLEIVQTVKRLTLPTLMGERFKVLALTRGIGGELVGFRIRDMRERL